MKIVKDVNLLDIIKSKLSEDELFKYYFGNFKIGGLYNSPLRLDKNPSFSFFYYNGNVKAKDFSTGETYSGIGYVMALYNLTFQDALIKICDDFNLTENCIKVEPITKVSKSNKDSSNIVSNFSNKKTDIKIIPKKFTENDINYWLSYGIRIETVKKFNIYSVNKLWINKTPITIKKDELCFAYYFPKSNHLKIYFPNRLKKNKWFTNTNNLTDIQGYWQANIKENKPELLILTSSMKEIMLLNEFNIKSLAINGEGNKFSEDFIRHIKKYCKNILSLYDWDEAGEKSANYLLELYNIKPIKQPDNLDCKDITDCWKEGKHEEIKQFLENIKILK